MNEKTRCLWAGNTPAMINYHDNEWGRPVHDDIKLFEMLTLEGMQAGLHGRQCLTREKHSERLSTV